MSGYQYVPYSIYKIDQHKDELTPEIIDQIFDPHPWELVIHQLKQFNEAIRAGSIDERWSRLDKATERAEKALNKEENDNRKTISAFIDMGRAIQSLLHPSDEEMEELYKLKYANDRRTVPTNAKNEFLRNIKMTAQYYALMLFKENKDMNITEAAKKTEKYIDDYRKLLNKRFTGYQKKENFTFTKVREWVSEIAPDEKRKPGRPKKQ